MHVFATFTTILTSAHKLIVDPSCASTSCSSSSIASTLVSWFTFLTDDSHPIKIILCKIEMLTRFVFHLFSLQIDWYLFYFEIIFLLSHTSRMNL